MSDFAKKLFNILKFYVIIISHNKFGIQLGFIKLKLKYVGTKNFFQLSWIDFTILSGNNHVTLLRDDVSRWYLWHHVRYWEWFGYLVTYWSQQLSTNQHSEIQETFDFLSYTSRCWCTYVTWMSLRVGSYEWFTVLLGVQAV